MGIPGAGKTRLAREHAGRGYLRLNRDERGGNLRDIATALRDELAAGAGRIVLDNTYLTRAARSYVLEAANGRGVPVRCVWLDISLADAQVNLVERMLERFGALPAPELIRRRREPGLMLPTSQMRTVRELEPPALEEGFASIERVPFTRAPQPGRTDAVVFVAAGVLASDGWQRLVRAACPAAAHLVFDWRPDGTPAALEPSVAALAGEVTGPTEAALCPHGGGPPSCWCRPPLPGLPLAFAHRHGADTGRSVLIGSSPAHRTLAATLGARFIDAAEPRTAARKKAKKKPKGSRPAADTPANRR
jgi:predicted kinase